MALQNTQLPSKNRTLIGVGLIALLAVAAFVLWPRVVRAAPNDDRSGSMMNSRDAGTRSGSMGTGSSGTTGTGTTGTGSTGTGSTTGGSTGTGSTGSMGGRDGGR